MRAPHFPAHIHYRRTMPLAVFNLNVRSAFLTARINCLLRPLRPPKRNRIQQQDSILHQLRPRDSWQYVGQVQYCVICGWQAPLQSLMHWKIWKEQKHVGYVQNEWMNGLGVANKFNLYAHTTCWGAVVNSNVLAHSQQTLPTQLYMYAPIVFRSPRIAAARKKRKEKNKKNTTIPSGVCHMHDWGVWCTTASILALLSGVSGDLRLQFE